MNLLGGQSALGTRLIGVNLDPQGFHYFVPEPGTPTLLGLAFALWPPLYAGESYRLAGKIPAPTT